MHFNRTGSRSTTFNAYDFKGNPLSTTQTLAQDYKNALDWSDTVTLESESFATTFIYDALNRVTSKTTPDESEALPVYNEAGFLESLGVKVRGAETETTFVSNIDYNARGQRTKIEYGNGAVTEYEYDEKTFRLTNLTTTADSTAIHLPSTRWAISSRSKTTPSRRYFSTTPRCRPRGNTNTTRCIV